MSLFFLISIFMNNIPLHDEKMYKLLYVLKKKTCLIAKMMMLSMTQKLR